MSAKSRALTRARRFKRRPNLKRHRLNPESATPAPSLFHDPEIQSGLLNAGLHILDAFVPGTRKAFEEGSKPKPRPLPESRQVDAPNVINVHANKDGVYE